MLQTYPVQNLKPIIMAEFTIHNITSFNRIETDTWNWREKSGVKVLIRGLEYVEPATQKHAMYKTVLEGLTKGNRVELKNAEFSNDEQDEIKCDVFLRGVNISSYFIGL